MSLFPTKTRLRLLRDVADGLVRYAPNASPPVMNLATTPPANVLSPTAEQRQAGWITVDVREGNDVLGAYPYELTGVGRAVLATAGLDSRD